MHASTQGARRGVYMRFIERYLFDGEIFPTGYGRIMEGYIYGGYGYIVY